MLLMQIYKTLFFTEICNFLRVFLSTEVFQTNNQQQTNES